MGDINTDLLHMMILRSLCDDYESVETILPDIARDVDASVTREEILQQMCRLANEGLVTAFMFDKEVGDYVSIAPDELKEDSWFLATERGIEIWRQRRDKSGSGIRLPENRRN